MDSGYGGEGEEPGDSRLTVISRPGDASASRGRPFTDNRKPFTPALARPYTRTPPNELGGVSYPTGVGPGSGGGGGIRLRPGLRGLRETQTQRLQFGDLLLAQLGEPLRHVLDRFGEPLLDVFRLRSDDATPHDMLEELVAGLLKWRGLDWGRVSATGISLLFGHVVGDRVVVQQI